MRINCIKIVYFTFFVFSACSDTRTGNPSVRLMLSEQGSVSSQSLRVEVLSEVSSLTFCFKRLRFKVDTDDAQASSNTDLDLGAVDFTGPDQELTSIELSAGTYRRIEFDLENDCGTGSSLQLVNANGDFETDDRITIKFDGEFVLGSNAEDLSLFLDSILSELENVTNESEIKERAEASSGAF